MPISERYQSRLYPNLDTIAQHFGTPFHIYDELGIRETCQMLKSQFERVNVPFCEYFAVKALPNPHILEIILSEGFGFDCSSIAELILARQVGATANDIFFTSNNTTHEEFAVALANEGCIINLDDVNHLDQLPRLPELICFRYNPGSRRVGNAIIGNPIESKFGITHEQIESAYRIAQQRGCTRFGLHTMIASNERNHDYIVETAKMLYALAEHIGQSLNIRFEFLNIGGGLGIPYRPTDHPLDLEALTEGIAQAQADFVRRTQYAPQIYLESGRYISGAHGVLITRAINRKDSYRTYIGVDANMSALMRPGMYGAYHHIEVVGKSSNPLETVDIVGSLCENNDKFAIQRELPSIEVGDLLVIQDTGAHGASMGFNYNGKLRPQELLLRADGRVERIRRAETLEDYFRTLMVESHTLRL